METTKDTNSKLPEIKVNYYNTTGGSDKYGNCELCGKKVDTVYHLVIKKNNIEMVSIFGHIKCCQKIERQFHVPMEELIQLQQLQELIQLQQLQEESKLEQLQEESKLEYVGSISVDAGLCMIGDPCYHIGRNTLPKAFNKTWPEFVNEELTFQNKPLNEVQLDHDSGASGLAVILGNFGGDGCYPVYVEKNKEGQVKRAIIEFNE